MPLLMLDLDNTLVDRDKAFSEAVGEFLAEFALPREDLPWVMSIDDSGYTTRHDVAAAIIDRYGSRVPASAVRALLDHGAADRVVLDDDCRRALDAAHSNAWACIIVTNGRVAQQTAKIRNAGLDQIVDGWVISEAVGHKKPEPEIFLAAARCVGGSLAGAWMVGDSAQADIAGAHNLGLSSVWIAGDRPWAHEGFHPTHIARDTESAIEHIINGQQQT